MQTKSFKLRELGPNGTMAFRTNEDNMPGETKTIKVKLTLDTYKKLKMICVDKDLSMSKQAADCLRNFVQIQEDNYKRFQK